MASARRPAAYLPAVPPHDGATACAVLTQPMLLSTITSFQRGLPGLVAALVHRYEADGWMTRTAHLVRARGPPAITSQTKVPIPCVVSQVSGRIWPPHAWHVRCALEACAAYDTSDAGYPALRRLLKALTSLDFPGSYYYEPRDYVCDAAAAMGRVDVLQWMHTAHAIDNLVSNFSTIAMRHGQLPVLEWIEATFGAQWLVRMGRNADDAAARGHGHVISWLQARKVRIYVAGGAIFTVVRRGDVAMLRLLQLEPMMVPGHELVAQAVASDQAEALAVLVGEWRVRATVYTLERALALGHAAAAACLVAHHALLRCRRPEQNPEAMPVYLLARIRAHGLVGDTASHQVVQRLLPLCPTDAVAAVLVKVAKREHVRWASRLLELAGDAYPVLTGCELPAAVTAYVGRVVTGTLGPLATIGCPLALHDTIERELPTATTDDVRDAALAMLLVYAPRDVAFLLELDAKQATPHCDAPFLALCAALCEQYPSRRAIQTVIATARLAQPTA